MNKNYPLIYKNDDTSADENYIVFSIASNRYALNIKNIVEVINIPNIEIPESMPNGIIGIFNYKGIMIKAIDMRPILGFPPDKFNINNKLIILRTNEEHIAIHADEIINIISIENSQIQNVPYSAENSILKNVYKKDDSQICIINLESLNNIISSNKTKQNSINYSELFPCDQKSKEILDLRSKNQPQNKKAYPFDYNSITQNQYILFTLDNDNFYIELKYVKEFSSTKRHKITKLPYTPEYIKGMTNHKGEFLVVVDLKLFLNMDNSVNTKTGKIIILKRKDFNIAFLVDDIKSIQNLNNLKPAIFNSNIAKYVYAEFMENDKLHTVLNSEKILNDERLYIDIS